VTTSQHLDKLAPPRWTRLFRRPPPVPGVDDARALAAANLRILQLEMDKATLQSRVDRLAGQCTPPCWHAASLEAAEVAKLRLRAEQDNIYAHIRDVLDKARAANSETPARADGDGGSR
jgi:hypothetical protein